MADPIVTNSGGGAVTPVTGVATAAVTTQNATVTPGPAIPATPGPVIPTTPVPAIPATTGQATPTTQGAATPTTPVPVTPTTPVPASPTTVSSDGIVIDKSKTPERYIMEAEAKYIVPALVRDKFSDLIKLIYETESMNEEERQYWLQIMPIMSEEQIVKFRDILVNERDQLAKLDKEYEKEIKKINKTPAPELDESKRKAEIDKIKGAERANEEKEKNDESNLLQKLTDL